MAARLVAAIEAGLGLEVTLVEGHDGIYEVSLNSAVVYTSKSVCSQGFPDDDDIVERIGRLTGITPNPRASKALADPEQAPACPIPDTER